MTSPRPTVAPSRALLRRANPLLMIAIGALLGASVTAIGHDPGKGDPVSARTDATSGAASATDGTGVEPGEAALPDAGATSPAGSGTATGSGAVASGSPAAGGRSAASSGPADACGAAKSSGVQGVTDTAIRIGFGVPDLSVFAAAGEAIDPGDIPKEINAILDGMRKDKRLPICGRDIQPFFRKYNVLQPEESRSACVGFTEQDKVFAVVTLYGFSAPDCVSREHRTFLLDSGNAVYDATYINNPLLFTTDPSIDALIRNQAHWLVKDGLLTGKKIGVYYNKQGAGGAIPPGRAVEQNFLDQLKKLGHPADVVVVTDRPALAAGQSGPDPNDKLAIQRFKQEGVQLVAAYTGDLVTEAKLQGYKPQWTLFGTAQASDAVSSTRDTEYFDKALGILFDHVGEAAAGVPASPLEQRCFNYWTAAGGKLPKSRDYALGQTLREICDMSDLFTRALTAVGNNLTTPNMVAGMESIKSAPMAYYTPQTFGPGKHWGGSQHVIEQYHGDCKCWKTTGPFRPLFTS
jgi:hypothetical protein